MYRVKIQYPHRKDELPEAYSFRATAESVANHANRNTPNSRYYYVEEIQ